MSLKNILLLGDPRLYEVSSPVIQSEIESLKPSIEILHNALMEFREEYGAGRAVAAPQIGLLKNFIYLNINEPIVIFNPELTDFSEEKMEVWDDCLCFPGLLVKVKRAKKIVLKFRDMNWEQHEWKLEGDLSELIQHEYDHLDGILATQRAVDDRSFKIKKHE
jgi:peptide deformylase